MENKNDNEFFFVVDEESSFTKPHNPQENEETSNNEILSNEINSSSEEESIDIMSHSKPEMEDIVSHSVAGADYFEEETELEPEVASTTALDPVEEYFGKGKHSKEKHGFGYWWRSLHTGWKVLIVSLLSIFIILGAGVIVLFTRYDINHEELDQEDLGFDGTVISEDIINIALFGIDTRSTKSFEGNSDSIMILSLNTKTKTVKITSVMRDTLVPIYPNKDSTKPVYEKINAAYARGGAQLAVKTLNQVFKLDISEYATVNFFGMVEIIDAVGGIDAELTAEEVVSSKRSKALNGCIQELCNKKGLNPDSYYITTPGKHHLNGIQAVAYSRIRKCRNIWGTNNDHGRTDRQRYVMEQLFNKAVKLNSLTEYDKLITSLLPYSKTSLYYDEIFSLAKNILMQSPKFEQVRIPTSEYEMGQPSTRRDSVVYFDLDYASRLLRAFIYDDITPENFIKQNGVEKNDWYAEVTGKSSFGGSSGGGSGGSSGGGNSSTPSTDVDPDSGTETPPEGDGTDIPPEGNDSETPPEGDGTDTPPEGDGSETPPEGDGSGTETPPEGDGGGTETPPEGDGGNTETPPAGDGGGAETPPGDSGNSEAV